ncbi:MAG TPA: hypothetical protein VF281_01490 [Candidatus Saccharimonadales bacterium]
MNNNEKSNVVRIDAWQRDKQLKEELRLIEASRPIEVPQYVKDEIVSIKALTKRRNMHIVHEVIDEVPKAADDSATSTGPEFYYDK